MSLDSIIIKKLEKDLRSYPDWLIKIEYDDFGGIGGKSFIGGGGSKSYNFSSSVEKQAENKIEIERKVYAIEKVVDRFKGPAKDIIKQRYFEDCSREEVLENTHLSKRQYYNLRNRAFESFARVLGYID